MKLAIIAAFGLALGASPVALRAQQSAAPLVPPGPTTPTPAQVAPAPATPPTGPALTAEDAGSWLDGIMPYAIARGDIAGAVVVVVKDGQVLLEKGYGYADAATHKPVDPDTTLFRPGSVSKLFTWTAVMQLVEQGKIDLDRDINAYLDFQIPPFDGKPVTMRNLMTHTAGFEEALKDLIADAPTPEPKLADYIKTHLPTRIYPPGEIPAYSNYGATLAGYIVQRLSGQPFDTYIEQHIFTPLGMQHASFRQPLPAALQPFMSNGYDTPEDGAKPWEIVIPAPAGSSSISGGDMAKFMIAHLQDGEYNGQRILQARTAQMMHSTALELLPPLNSMLLGFYQMNRNGHHIIGHAGDSRWFHSELTLFPDDHVGLFVSLNSVGKDGAAGPVRRALREGFTDRYFPGPGPTGSVDPAVAAHDALRLAGTYVSSRRPETSAFSLLGYVLLTSSVTADGGGKISAGGVETLAGQPQHFEPMGAFLWRAAGGQTRLAAKLQGDNIMMWGEDETSAVEVNMPPPWYKNGAWLKPSLIASIAFLLLTAIFWPVVALFRRRYGASFALAGAPAYAYRLTRVASLLDALVILAWIGTLVQMLNAFWLSAAMDPVLLTLHWAAMVIFPLALLVFVWNAWVVFTTRAGWRSWFAKLWSVALLFSGISLVWIGTAFHLFGTGLQY
jgi:CubicO group peptidase (beta-lactamase class C family)